MLCACYHLQMLSENLVWKKYSKSLVSLCFACEFFIVALLICISDYFNMAWPPDNFQVSLFLYQSQLTFI